jgi:hypothetical protein
MPFGGHKAREFSRAVPDLYYPLSAIGYPLPVTMRTP